MAFPTSVNSQITDDVTDSEPAAPGESVTQAVLLSIGTTPAKAIGAALGSMAQAAGIQMNNAAASYQAWTTVQRAIVTQAASEIFASTTPFDGPAAGAKQGA